MFEVNSSTITNSSLVDTALNLSPATNAVLLTANIIIVTTGILGNGIILFGSLIYKAIHLDRVSLIFLESVALSDLVITLMVYLPNLVTLSAQRWVMGQGLCWFLAFFKYVPYLSEILVILVTSCFRLKTLMSPMSSKMSPRSAKIIVFLAWLSSLLFALVWSCTGTYAEYMPLYLHCHPSLKKTTVSSIFRLSVMLLIMLPMVVIVSANISILRIVRGFRGDGRVPLKKLPQSSAAADTSGQETSGKDVSSGRRDVSGSSEQSHVQSCVVLHNTAPNRKALVTISCICWAFIVSYVPFANYIILILARVQLPVWLGKFLKIFVLL